MDTTFRANVQKPEALWEFGDLPPEESEAVAWAIRTCQLIAGGSVMLSEENDCKAHVPGIANPGTADLVFPELCAHADLKSGQVRNYMEQMAAYALAFMVAHFETKWTAHLLFCDQREFITLEFTLEEARAIVEDVIASAKAPDRQATPCQYCSWCGLAETCQARLDLAAVAHVALSVREGFQAILDNPPKLLEFLAACKALEDFEKLGKERMKTYLQGGRAMPGWKMQSRRGNEFVDPVTIASFFPDLPPLNLAAAYGTMSGEKFRRLWAAERPGQDIPANVIGTADETTFPVRERQKKQHA